MELDTRKRLVLRAVVEDYVQSAEPVGSRTLARKHPFGVSPATLRMEMADLEEMGYLDKPHTSAGRIPSDKGYRFYVDRLMGAPHLAPEEARRIQNAFRRRMRSAEWLVQQTVRLLAQVTPYACVAVAPGVEEAAVERLSILPLGQGGALLVLVTDRGTLHHSWLDVPPGLGEKDLRAAAQLLSRYLHGVPLTGLRSSPLEDLRRELADRRALLDQILAFLVDEVAQAAAEETRVFVSGAAHVAQEPEFQDVERLRTLVGILEEDRLVAELLDEVADDPVGVVIGEEHHVPAARDLALVMANVQLGRVGYARFGVLGPKRMDYGRVLALVTEVQQTLERAIS